MAGKIYRIKKAKKILTKSKYVIIFPHGDYFFEDFSKTGFFENSKDDVFQGKQLNNKDNFKDHVLKLEYLGTTETIYSHYPELFI